MIGMRALEFVPRLYKSILISPNSFGKKGYLAAG